MRSFAMKEDKRFLHNLVYRNKIRLICEAFTLVTIIDIIASMIGEGSTSHEHLLSRLIVVALSALSIEIFKIKKLPIIPKFIAHFLVCVGIMVAYTWLSGFFWELHPRAYWYGIRSVLIVYPILVVAVIITNVLTRKKSGS